MRKLLTGALLVGCWAGGFCLGYFVLGPALHPTHRAVPQVAPYADPEQPANIFAQSLGPLPGTHGSNGRLTANSLAPIYNGQLARPAAAAWNSMNLYSRRYLHRNILSGGTDASYRTYNRQVYWRSYWCGQGRCENAAVPGTSNHGWGRADDLASGDHHGTFDQVGPKFGWRWGEVTYEPWHVTDFASGYAYPDPGPDYNNPRLCHGSGGPGQAGFVKDVQHALSRNHIPGVTNGYFTQGTVGRLERFQRARRLPVHSCVDRAAWKQLRKR